MKTNELMIGDWVKTPKSFFKVTDIQDNDVIGTNYNNGEGADSLFFSDEIEPIPLTQEILEKNGFTRFARTNWYVDTYRPFYLKNPSNPNDYKDNYWLRVGDCMNRIEYVNELQHALRLCGIKKEIII